MKSHNSKSTIKCYLRIIFTAQLLVIVFLMAAGCSFRSRSYNFLNPGNNENYSLKIEPPVQMYTRYRVMKGRLSGQGLVAIGEDVVPCRGQIIFRKNGIPVLVNLSSPVPLLFMPQSTHRVLFTGEILLDGDLVKSGVLSEAAALSYGSMRKRILFPEDTFIWFDAAGGVSSFVLAKPPKETQADKSLSDLEPNIRYTINNTGKIVPFTY